jgi:hypothetical protein
LEINVPDISLSGVLVQHRAIFDALKERKFLDASAMQQWKQDASRQSLPILKENRSNHPPAHELRHAPKRLAEISRDPQRRLLYTRQLYVSVSFIPPPGPCKCFWNNQFQCPGTSDTSR